MTKLPSGLLVPDEVAEQVKHCQIVALDREYARGKLLTLAVATAIICGVYLFRWIIG